MAREKDIGAIEEMTQQTNLYIDQGIDYSISLDIFDNDDLEYNIDEHEFHASARKVYSSINSFDFVITIVDENTINIGVPAQTETNPGKYQYDVIMVKPDGTKVKLMEGLVFVLPTLTSTG